MTQLVVEVSDPFFELLQLEAADENRSIETFVRGALHRELSARLHNITTAEPAVEVPDDVYHRAELWAEHTDTTPEVALTNALDLRPQYRAD